MYMCVYMYMYIYTEHRFRSVRKTASLLCCAGGAESASKLT